MREQIKDVVLKAIGEYNDEADVKIDLAQGEKTRLYGGSGVLTSLNLVGLIVMIEEAVEDAFDRSITLADEKAMSRRVSPFASIETLVDYINELMSRENG